MLGEISLADELDRKTIEALTRIADEQSRSLMSEREARLAIRAVFESVQGLVGDDVGEVLNVAMSSDLSSPCISKWLPALFCMCRFVWIPMKFAFSTSPLVSGVRR